MDIDNWQLCLGRWSGQWVAAQAALDPEEVDEGALAAGGLAGAHLDQEAEIRALDATAEAFGVTLPRFALRHGRLHVVRGASWTRRPGPGESTCR